MVRFSSMAQGQRAACPLRTGVRGLDRGYGARSYVYFTLLHADGIELDGDGGQMVQWTAQPIVGSEPPNGAEGLPRSLGGRCDA